ncbi:hypothetical protein BKA69DRAFT_1103293 [Paraphysoderma sedebokerense]|nr:hypothetical protein BKA69DRAFT_1103293 [Paraphysoderma sedebokerense]
MIKGIFNSCKPIDFVRLWQLVVVILINILPSRGRILMSARQFDNPAVIGPRVESHKNLFFETEVDFNTPFQHQSTPPDTRFVSGNGTSNIKSKARFLVSGSAAQLFDATHPSITVKQMPQCRIPYAQTSITCDASNRSECNKLQTPGIIVLIPCHGDRSRNIRVADLQALGNVNANITMPLPEKDFYLGIAGGKVENDDNQPTRDQPFMRSNITNSLLLNGQIGFHILPAVKFHIDDLVGQHQASVGMHFDSGITIRGQPVSSQAVSACLNGTAEISGKVISELSGKVVAREAIDSISTPLFNTCSQNDLSSPDHSKLVADVNPNL